MELYQIVNKHFLPVLEGTERSQIKVNDKIIISKRPQFKAWFILSLYRQLPRTLKEHGQGNKWVFEQLEYENYVVVYCGGEFATGVDALKHFTENTEKFKNIDERLRDETLVELKDGSF
jgi:hypothetical protein